MIITELERSELLDHFEQDRFVWSGGPDLWLFSDEEKDLLTLQIQKHNLAGVFVYSLSATPLTEIDPVEVIRDLVESWTSYPIRERIEELLRTSGTNDPEMRAIQVQELYSKPQRLHASARMIKDLLPTNRPESVYVFSQGGYLLITPAGEHLHATVSLPSLRHHLAFGTPLSGFLTGILRGHQNGVA